MTPAQPRNRKEVRVMAEPTAPELKPCPFCGAEPEIGGPQQSVSGTYYWITCSCGGQGPQSTSVESAVQLWNVRADLATPCLNTPEEEAQAIADVVRPCATDEQYTSVVDAITAALKAREAATWKQAIEKSQETGNKAIGVFGAYPMVAATVDSIIADLESAAAQQKGSDLATPAAAKIPSDFISAKGEIVDWDERPAADTCEWKNDGDDSWWTACGESFVFTDGGPKENSQKFCGYCGKTLIENRVEETYAEDE